MSSNFSIEEIIKYKPHLAQHELEKLIDQLQEKVVELESELQYVRKSDELTYEQSEFAKEVIREILSVVSRETRAKEMKTQIRNIVDNSYVEL